MGANTSPQCLLDLQSGSIAEGTLMVGGNYNASGLTNNAAKAGGIHIPHYGNTTYPKGFRALSGYSDNGINLVQIGGGTNDVRSATDIRFYTATSSSANGSEIARFDASGNAMFGCTVSRPAEFAHPDGFAIRTDVKGQFQSTVDANACAILNRDSSDGNILSFRREGADVGHIGVNGTTTYLQFGGTNAAAHQLDDYQEGQWTPVLKYLDANNDWQNCTYSNALDYTDGRFVKVGQIVHGWYYTGYFTMDSAANNRPAKIYGLPFNLINVEPYYGGTCIFTNQYCFDGNVSAAFVCSGYMNYAQSHIQPMKGTSGIGGADWNTGGHYMMVSFTYQTDG